MTFDVIEDTFCKPVLKEDLVAPEIREGFVSLSAAQAGAVRRQLRYERQNRDLKPSGEAHMRVLADLMWRNHWRQKEKIDFARLDGRLILMNGHHRLGAQALSGAKIEWIVVIHECTSPEEVAELYFSFDTNVRIRTSDTILSVVDLPRVLGVERQTATRLWGAIPLIANNFDFNRTDRMPIIDKAIDRRLEFAKSYKREIVGWEKAVAPASKALRKKLSSQGALAVALLAWRYQPHTAETFWGGLALNDGLRKGDPRHTYNRYLNGEYEGKNVTGATARYAASAWNAWYNEKTQEILRVSSAFYIEGVPSSCYSASHGKTIAPSGG